MKAKDNPGEKVVCRNRRATHTYHVEKRQEAGIVLTGTEVKSLRAGQADLSDAYASFKGSELFLVNLHISDVPLFDTSVEDTVFDTITDNIPDIVDIPIDTIDDSLVDSSEPILCNPSSGGDCNIVEQCECNDGYWCKWVLDYPRCQYIERCVASEPGILLPGEECNPFASDLKSDWLGYFFLDERQWPRMIVQVSAWCGCAGRRRGREAPRARARGRA